MKSSHSTHKEEAPLIGKMVRPVLIGAVVGAACCLLLLLLFAAVMAAKDIPQGAVTPMAVVAAAAGSFVGGFVAARIGKMKGILFGAACGLLLYLVVMVAGYAVLKDIRGIYALVKLAIMLGCGAVGGILGVNTRKK